MSNYKVPAEVLEDDKTFGEWINVALRQLVEFKETTKNSDRQVNKLVSIGMLAYFVLLVDASADQNDTYFVNRHVCGLQLETIQYAKKSLGLNGKMMIPWLLMKIYYLKEP